MDKLQAMQLFARVVETGSYTAAAEQLEISRALASKLVQALEDQLGVRLLHRTTRRLSLTEAGQNYYQRVAEILAQLAEAEAEAAELQLEPRGRLRVSAPMSFSILHLGAALADFQRKYPRVELELNLNDRVVDLVEDGFDLAIRIGRLADSSLVARRLAGSQIVAVAAPAYLAWHGMPSHPDDLAHHNCLDYTLSPRRDEWQFARGEERVNVRVRGNLHVNNGDMIALAAAQGLGVALSPAFIVHDALRRGDLVRVLPEWQLPDIGVYAVYPAGRSLPAKTRSLIDFLAERFRPSAPWDLA
ncbi:MAG TPA: LysR family transcriptional regulator [Rhodanobacteraceae bacterium]|nr:LysR family transcriptional regulator [Rhodanobacteraceae bacterium]